MDSDVLAVAASLAAVRPDPLECCVCLTALTAGTTALLPCCHGFHRDCLEKQAEAHKGEALRCGVCGTAAPRVTEGADVAALPADVLAEAALAAQAKPDAGERAATGARGCGLCEEEAPDEKVVAVAQCTTCGKRLCSGHRSIHQSRKVFAGHVIERLAAAPATPVCPAHPDRPMEMYCTTCAALCCSLCEATTHPQPEHQTCALAAHAPELRKGLKRAYDVGTEHSASQVKRLAGLRSTLGAVDARTAKLEDEVNRTMDVLVQRLALRREQLLREVTVLATEERAALEQEQEADQRRWLALDGALRAAQRLGAADTRVDHLGQLATPVEAYLTTVTREAVAAAAPLAVMIEFVVADDVARILSTAGRFVRHEGYGPECVAEGPGTAKAVVSTGGRFTVTVWTRTKGRVRVGGDRVTARLISDANGGATEATVVDAVDGTHTVTYAVPAVGAYHLEAAVNGRSIRGSPFAVTASAGRLFTFTGPPYYDNCGVIYYLATAGGTRPWRNPHNAGIVAVAFSSNKNNCDVSLFVANAYPDHNTECSTENKTSSKITVSLKGKRVIPNGYVLSTDGYGFGDNFLRSWRLDGSANGVSWATLRTHANDWSLTKDTPTGYWSVDGDARGAYSFFRIQLTGKNSSGQNNLCATNFEIYGELLDP